MVSYNELIHTTGNEIIGDEDIVIVENLEKGEKVVDDKKCDLLVFDIIIYNESLLNLERYKFILWGLLESGGFRLYKSKNLQKYV